LTAPGTAPAATGYQVIGVSVLDEYVLPGDAGLAMAMVTVELRKSRERIVARTGRPAD
jgi:hypothetical protein